MSRNFLGFLPKGVVYGYFRGKKQEDKPEVEVISLYGYVVTFYS